jgi:BASS family bile acid:Na+ symporter
METLHLLFNAITVIFIAATMFAAGLGATLPPRMASAAALTPALRLRPGPPVPDAYLRGGHS